MNRDKKMGKSRERKYGLQDICLIVYNFNIVTESGKNSIVICNLADEYKKRVVFWGIYYKIYPFRKKTPTFKVGDELRLLLT